MRGGEFREGTEYSLMSEPEVSLKDDLEKGH